MLLYDGGDLLVREPVTFDIADPLLDIIIFTGSLTGQAQKKNFFVVFAGHACV